MRCEEFPHDASAWSSDGRHFTQATRHAGGYNHLGLPFEIYLEA